MLRITRGKERRGAAVVEMAIVAPLLCTLLLGIIEYGWVFSVRQALTNAAREGARTAALAGSTSADVQNRVSSFLQPYHLQNYTMTLTRSTPQNPNETVAISVPYRNVTLMGGFFGNTNFNLATTCSMRKEGAE
jgi:Flp pilus assembly protein TadG